eukprot:7604162-Alexandrium_andersonii.AAC.1
MLGPQPAGLARCGTAPGVQQYPERQAAPTQATQYTRERRQGPCEALQGRPDGGDSTGPNGTWPVE